MLMMQNKFTFQLQANRNLARAGIMSTPHGKIATPVFMPVGTQATVKALDSGDIAKTGAAIILANTYHLYLRPGIDILTEMGGVHQLMNWSSPMLTDSGGFQVFSLAKKDHSKLDGESLVKVSDEGVEFRSHLDGSTHFFTPEKAIETQRIIGADIIMAFDECSPDQANTQDLQKSLNRTHAWARRCLDYHQSKQRLSQYGNYQALFGIIQGGSDQRLRQLSAEYLTSLPFDGIAVGGESIGFEMSTTARIMGWIESMLPQDKPRYAMGLGRDPQDIIDATLMGFDMFDCVGPTRLARNGSLYSGVLQLKADRPEFISEFPHGKLTIGNARFADDSAPIDANCDCYTCSSDYSRAYLRHLYIAKELSYYRLASIHNVRFMVRLANDLRLWIIDHKHH